MARTLRHSLDRLTALALGAALMYAFDPRQGRGRVARARDRLGRLARRGGRVLDAGWRDLSNRAAGWVARGRGAWRSDAPEDDVLLERVRAQLGRCVSHPHAVEVSVNDGWVTLAGDVLAHEAAGLVREVNAVRGVRHVKNELALHDGHDVPPRLLGQRVRGRYAARAGWPPGPRLAVLGCGAALVLAGARRGGTSGTVLALAGAVLATRAATDGAALPLRADATPGAGRAAPSGHRPPWDLEDEAATSAGELRRQRVRAGTVPVGAADANAGVTPASDAGSF